MAPRDNYYHPALNQGDAMAMAREDWEAMERRRETEGGTAAEDYVIRQLADAYMASNSSTMRAYKRMGLLGG